MEKWGINQNAEVLMRLSFFKSTWRHKYMFKIILHF
jgi:hypothetical protein